MPKTNGQLLSKRSGNTENSDDYRGRVSKSSPVEKSDSHARWRNMGNIINLFLWCVVVTITFHLYGINWLTVGYWGAVAVLRPLIYRMIFGGEE